MLKKLLSLLTLTIFIGINSAQPSTNAATKINDILSKMGVVNTTSPTGDYTEVSPDTHINTYNANHELINSTQVSEHIKNLLNKPNANKREQIEAEFSLYRLGTRLEIQNRPSQSSKLSKFMKKFKELLPGLISANLMDFGFKSIIDSAISSEKTKTKIEKALRFNIFIIPRLIVFSCMPHIVFTCIATLNKSSEKQDEEELNKKTFYNFALYTDTDYSYLLGKMQFLSLRNASEKEDTDYSYLLEKMQSFPLKKAFEQGIKARKNKSLHS